jgi:adenylate kinase family enzyme
MRRVVILGRGGAGKSALARQLGEVSKAGGKFDSQIEQGEQKAEEFMGTDQQGGQDQQAGNP